MDDETYNLMRMKLNNVDRTKQFPILPDIGEGMEDNDGMGDLIKVNPVQDGHPWAKACDECAFKDKQQRISYLKGADKSGNLFYCVHREDKGENRLCAGFAACRKNLAK